MFVSYMPANFLGQQSAHPPPTGRACDVMPRGGFSVAAAEMLERAQALLQQALPKWEAF